MKTGGLWAQKRDIDTDRRALLAAAILAVAAMLAIPALLDFHVDLRSFYPVAVVAGVPAIFLPYARWRGMDRLAAGLETTALGLLLTVPVLVFTYASVRVGMPLADATLRGWDAALGFDWPAWVRRVDRSEALATALSLGYSSFAFQLVALPGLLCVARLPGRAYRLVLGYLLLCILSAIVSVPFPAEAAYVTHQFDAGTLQHVDGHFGRFFLRSFEAARSGQAFTLRFGDAAGVLTFPSVHAGVAALCAWAAWPSRVLRALFLPLNLLMATSAITDGAHYLVDIIAGGVAATVVVASMPRLIRALERAPAPARSVPAFARG